MAMWSTNFKITPSKTDFLPSRSIYYFDENIQFADLNITSHLSFARFVFCNVSSVAALK